MDWIHARVHVMFQIQPNQTLKKMYGGTKRKKKKMHKANVGLPNPSIYFSKCANIKSITGRSYLKFGGLQFCPNVKHFEI